MSVSRNPEDFRIGSHCALPASLLPCDTPHMNEIIFQVREDEGDGGFVATALGHAIATQGETVEELLSKLDL